MFVQIPSLAAGDWKPAVSRGYETQIDDRGIDYDAGTADSPLHRTGAIYERAPATVRASRPAGDWNIFEIETRGPDGDRTAYVQDPGGNIWYIATPRPPRVVR